MTNEQVATLNLGIQPINAKTCLTVESAFNWVLENTTLEFDINNIEELKTLPAQVRLFVIEYNEIMSKNTGVVSESIEGLSQSFKFDSKKALIWEAAESLFPDEWLKSPVRFISSSKRWL